MELVSSARMQSMKRYATGIEKFSQEIVELIVTAVIPTNAKEFSFPARSSSITYTVNTTNSVSQSAVTVLKLLEAFIRTFFFQTT